ncbi:MAG: trigger factor [Ardenticatenales bacterium]
MHVTTEEMDDHQRKVTIVVTDDELAQAKQDVAKALGKNARVPGYRPGTAPIDRLEALLGAEALENEAMERLATRGVRKAVPASEAFTGAPMGAQVTSHAPFTIEVTVPLQPTVTLGAYRDLRVAPPEAPPTTDDDVDAVLEGWRREMALLTDVDRPAAKGDVITTSLVGRRGEDAVFESDALTLVLDPDRFDATQLPPAIIDSLVGATAGGTLDFTITYPAFWPEAALQEQPVAFSGSVTRIAELQLPELDDELAATLADVDSVAGLRARVRDQLAERARMSLQDQHVEAAIDALVDTASVAFPPQMVEAEIRRYVHELKGRVERQGLDFEQWLGLQPEGAEKLYAQIEVEAAQRLRRQLVLSAFCEAESIRVRSSEIDQEVRFFSRLTSMQQQAGAARPTGMPSVGDMRNSFGSRILSSRAVARLMAITNGQQATDDQEIPVAATTTV